MFREPIVECLHLAGEGHACASEEASENDNEKARAQSFPIGVSGSGSAREFGLRPSRV